MARKLEYKKAFPDLVMDMALARHKLTNSMVAKRLDVSESTVRNWRKDHPDFNRAFTDAREMLREKITNTARKSLDVRKRKTVIDGPKGRTIQVEDIVPTHNDVAVFSKHLGLNAPIHSYENSQRETLRTVMKNKVSGKISALEAAQLLEAEGIDVPKTLLMELAPAAKTSAGWLTLKSGETVMPGSVSPDGFTVRFIGMTSTEPAKPDGNDDGNSAQ